MGLFSFIGEKLYDMADAAIDSLDRGFDKFSSTVDNIIEKAEDVRYSIETGLIDLEYGVKEIINDVSYTVKTGDTEGFDWIKHDVMTLRDNITNTQIEITKDVAKIIDSYYSLVDQVNFVKNKFKVTTDTATRLVNEYKRKK